MSKKQVLCVSKYLCAALPGNQSRADSNWEMERKDPPTAPWGLRGPGRCLEDFGKVCFTLFLLLPQQSCVSLGISKVIFHQTQVKQMSLGSLSKAGRDNFHL